MTQIGSEAWIEQQRPRVESLAIDPGLAMVVQLTIDGDEGTSWHLTIADGGARLDPNPHAAPDVTLHADRATIDAITGGRSSAQREFLDGRLRIAGDIRLLLAAHDAIHA